MENIPPSYQVAVARNPWGIIAPYISSADLCALNRVNRELHRVFAPCLWGNPASHFGTENDRVYGDYPSKAMKTYLLIWTSCIDTLQKNSETGSTECERADPYPASSSRPVRGKTTATDCSERTRPLTPLKDLRWTSPGMASRCLGAAAEPPIPRRLATPIL